MLRWPMGFASGGQAYEVAGWWCCVLWVAALVLTIEAEFDFARCYRMVAASLAVCSPGVLISEPPGGPTPGRSRPGERGCPAACLGAGASPMPPDFLRLAGRAVRLTSRGIARDALTDVRSELVKP
jgi:hypothetical protein